MNEAIVSRLGERHAWSITASLAHSAPSESKAFSILLMSDRTGSLKQTIFGNTLECIKILGAIFPRKLRMKSKLRFENDIDLALDVSGYCFGDHWGQERVDHSTKLYRDLKLAGSRIVLMPKTWGPFEKISPESLDKMFEYVELAFARDIRSLENISKMVSQENARKIKFAPDYTHSVEVPVLTKPASPPHCYIIPSKRVIDSGAMAEGKYLEVLRSAKVVAESHGLDVKLLIHEVSNDLWFVENSSRIGFSASDVVVARDARHAKSLISAARFVITSRLHGLYNALNSSVPPIVLAWSFKYKEALVQYGVEECLIDLEYAEPQLAKLIENFAMQGSHRASVEARMREGRAESSKASEQMWEAINRIIDEIELEEVVA